MSADRYEITDNDASIRCQKPGKGPLILYSCDHDSSTQKIIAVIRQLQADLAAVTAERDLFSQMVADQRLVIEDLEHRRARAGHGLHRRHWYGRVRRRRRRRPDPRPN